MYSSYYYNPINQQLFNLYPYTYYTSLPHSPSLYCPIVINQIISPQNIAETNPFIQMQFQSTPNNSAKYSINQPISTEEAKNSHNNQVKKNSNEIGKKVMRNFINCSLRRMLNQMLKADNCTTPHILRKFKPNTTYNLNINKMKSFISKTVKELYEIDNDSENLRIINDFEKDNIAFQNRMSQRFDEAYLNYLDSSEFVYDINKIKEKKPKGYVDEYADHVKNFLGYYKQKIPNKTKVELCN
jgi:hypothetical protein